ncbi:TNF receptor-associated factor 3-like isoform X2 [Halichondria panicea]|uniref:TNF receptor-associated factor 3-like isoform X2 n=1 Tax=Halichondria panicea TaxID=6063 RepID=UPI00312BAD22
MSGTNIRCIFCSKYLISGTNPRQATCGDRLCGACFTEREKGEREILCPVCHEMIILPESFRDKAVEVEAANVTAKCSNKDCPWEGLCKNLESHEGDCKFGMVKCPNSGCSVMLPREQVEVHRQQCYYQQVSCHLCGISMARGNIQAHIDRDCLASAVECGNKCGVKVARGMGTSKQLQEHESKGVVFHLRCVSKTVDELKNTSALLARCVPQPTTEKLATERDKALSQAVADITEKLKTMGDNITDKLEPAVFHLQEAANEMGVTLQTVQATTYDGKFIWKIPEVLRRRNEARSGKTISLYSAPFYTSRHGYKLCLRLYMNGDGSGKGTHLSFFITLMRGEYDALLPWPFRQAVNLTLVDQNKQRDIVQSFRPEPTSSSFQRPRNEMNVASGCPTFALVSVLDNVSYVKDDTLFLKCKVDLIGLESIY